MIHPRKRTVWSRWIEGFEARALERKFSKDEILEFYLNEIPYASNRRGIHQAAQYYFNRSPDTLNLKETLALVVLVRAPSAYDPYKNPGVIEPVIRSYAKSLYNKRKITKDEYNDVERENLVLEKPGHDVDAGFFARYVYTNSTETESGKSVKIRTSLDGIFQTQVMAMMEKTLHDLKNRKVKNGACLVADHSTGEILAWVSIGTGNDDTSGSAIDGVTTPRQPGSSMKPFLYALALEKGWTAAQEIEDSPLTNPVGRGLHTFHNYSRVNYGRVTLREALGNSLNIPAVKTIRFVGHADYLNRLHTMGFTSLDKPADFYGDGLALGSGEVTLLEMVRAYVCLAENGTLKPLSPYADPGPVPLQPRIYTEEASSLIGNILSDPQARELEFGQGGLLNFPVQTAVKTGTSTDYRDSWAFGYNHRYVAGVWMGNFDAVAMDGVTGANGPALLLRSVFAELNKRGETRPLYLSPRLVQKEVCIRTGQGNGPCVKRYEWFIPGTEPRSISKETKPERIGFIKPVNGLEMAMDPRIPDKDEAFEFELSGVSSDDRVVWTLDSHIIADRKGGRYIWYLKKGRHVVEADIYKNGRVIHDRVTFVVK
jgi:penicillin-binding protein 1C